MDYKLIPARAIKVGDKSGSYKANRVNRTDEFVVVEWAHPDGFFVDETYRPSDPLMVARQ